MMVHFLGEDQAISVENQQGAIKVELFRSFYSVEAEQEFKRYERYAKADLPIYQDGAFWIISSIKVESTGSALGSEVIVTGVAVYDDDTTRKAWLQAAAKIEMREKAIEA